MLEDAGLAEETGRGRAYRCECRLGIMTAQLATLHASVYVARDSKAACIVVDSKIAIFHKVSEN